MSPGSPLDSGYTGGALKLLIYTDCSKHDEIVLENLQSFPLTVNYWRLQHMSAPLKLLYFECIYIKTIKVENHMLKSKPQINSSIGLNLYKAKSDMS